MTRHHERYEAFHDEVHNEHSQVVWTDDGDAVLCEYCADAIHIQQREHIITIPANAWGVVRGALNAMAAHVDGGDPED